MDKEIHVLLRLDVTSLPGKAIDRFGYKFSSIQQRLNPH